MGSWPILRGLALSLGSDFRQQPKFKRGREGEKVVAGWLMERGWHVIPSYDYSGEDGDKAPKMTGKHTAFVLPDLDIAQNGKRMWAEVKTKAEATLHRKTQTLEHGISLRHFRDYKRIQVITGCDVYVFVYEECSESLLMRPIGEESDGRVYDGGKMGRGGMIFWPRSSFKLVAEVPA